MSFNIDTQWISYSPTFSPSGYSMISPQGFVQISPQCHNNHHFNSIENNEQGEWTKKKNAILSCFCCSKNIYNNHICNGEDKNNCDCSSKIRVKNGYIFPICKECSELTTELAEKLFGKSQIHKGRLYGLPNGREISNFILYTLVDSSSTNLKKRKIDEINEKNEDDYIHMAHGFDVEKIEIGFCGVCGFKTESKGAYLDAHQESTDFCPCCKKQTLVKTKCWVMLPEISENKIIIKRTMTDTETLLCNDENNSNAILPINDFKRKRNCFNRTYYPNHWNWTNNDNKAVKIATSLIIRKYKELEGSFKSDTILIEIDDTIENSQIITKRLGLVKKISFEYNEELENISNNSYIDEHDNNKSKKRLSPVSVVEHFDDEYAF